MTGRLNALALFFGFLLLILPFLGRGEIFQVSEGREGVVVNEILSSGNYVLPLRNGEIVPSKPILFHWFGALAAKASGRYTEFELRLPSAIAGAATAAMIYLLVANLAGSGAGFIAAAILFSTSAFYQLSMDGRVDMLFNFFVVSAIAYWLIAAARVAEQGLSLRMVEARVYLWLGILVGLAILTKGPLGLVLPLLVVGAIAFYYERWRGLVALMRWGWLIALPVAAPWYVAASFAGKDSFVERQLFFENFLRFFGGEGITPHPPWFYFEHLPVELLPWTPLLLAVGWLVVWQRTELPPRTPREKFAITAGLVWFVVGFVFLSLSAGKRRAYLVPLFPGLVMALVVWLQVYWRGFNWNEQQRFFTWKGKWGGVVWIFLTSTAALVPLFLPLDLWRSYTTTPKGVVALESFLEVVGTHGFFFLLLLLLLNGTALILWLSGFKNRDLRPAIIGLFLMLHVPLAVFVNFGLILKGRTHGFKDFAAQVAVAVPQATPIKIVKTRRDESFDGFFFYLNRHLVLLPPDGVYTEPGIYLARNSWLAAQSEEFRGRMRILLEGGRLTDAEERKLKLFELQD